MAISIETTYSDIACIKVIGIGGGGGNAVNNMIERGLQGVEFIAANTDAQALERNLAPVKLQIGKNTTRGLGAGADPEKGRAALDESKEQIKEVLKGSDMIFVTAGMGGGTGTGGAPVVAQIGQELNALVVGIVTKPFSYEGKRVKVADEWISKLRENVDALITIPNNRVLEIIDKDCSFKEAFFKVDEVLFNATKGIADIINQHGIMNVDFADVRTIMTGMGDAIMGVGIARGENRAINAAKMALSSPLLDGVTIEGAKGILVNISSDNPRMKEIEEAMTMIKEAAGGEPNIIQGIVENSELEDELMITVIATGFNMNTNAKEVKAVETKAVEVPVEAPVQNNQQQNYMNRPLTKQFNPNRPNQMPARANYETAPTTANDWDMKPSGKNQLEKFDEPAFNRKAMNGAMLGDMGRMKAEQINEAAKVNTNGRPQFANTSQPTFIRKIMD